MLSSIREAIPPVHREGWPYLAFTGALAILFAIIFPPLYWILSILFGWMVVFFRDPVRVVPTAPGLVVSPADGRVEPIAQATPPPELGLGQNRLSRVSIFM